MLNLYPVLCFCENISISKKFVQSKIQNTTLYVYAHHTYILESKKCFEIQVLTIFGMYCE